jgi:endonuclease-3
MNEKIVGLLNKLRAYNPDLGKQSPKDPYKVMVNCILSHRTREENAEKASNNLFNRIQSPQQLLRLPDDELKELIRCSGFYNQKVRYLKESSKVIHETYKNNVPTKIEQLIKLPGVGIKTAAIILNYGFGEPQIAVDVHVSRVSKRTGLVIIKATSKKVKVTLESLFNKTDWNLIDNSFYRIGRKYCKNKKPRCEDCPITEYCNKKGI